MTVLVASDDRPADSGYRQFPQFFTKGQQQREKLQRQILNENEQSFQAKKTEFEICDELVSRFNDNKGGNLAFDFIIRV